eukprot:5756744-Prymnesium_polylepis.1
MLGSGAESGMGESAVAVMHGILIVGRTRTPRCGDRAPLSRGTSMLIDMAAFLIDIRKDFLDVRLSFAT